MKTALFSLPFFLMLFAGLVIPSDGNHGILSPKSLSFLASAGSLSFLFLARQQLQSFHLKLLLLTFGAISFLLFWFLLGTQNGNVFSAPTDQFKLFLITLSVPMMAVYLIQSKITSPQTIFKVIFGSSFFYSFSKILLVVLHFLKVVNLWEILNLLGVRFMSMSIYGGLERIQTSVDIITPFLVLFILHSKTLGINLPKGFKALYLSITFLSNLLSFSRFLIFIYFFSFILYGCTLSFPRLLKGTLLFGFLFFATIILIGIEHILPVIAMRFNSLDNYYSDQTRFEQMDALLSAHQKVPLLGQGMGGYVESYIRDEELKHSYEVQWFAFLMQFGLIGTSIILLPLIWIAYRLMQVSDRTSLSFLVLFLFWLLSGFTNPFLISLTSGIVYSMFILVPSMIDSSFIQQSTSNKAGLKEGSQAVSAWKK